MNARSFALVGAGETAPDSIQRLLRPALCKRTALLRVGQDAEALERSITHAGEQMLAWAAEWERTSCFSARGCADFWLRKQAELIAQRSAATVAAMEQAGGLV